MKLIGITGAAGSGKSTIANHLVLRHGFREIALAAPIKTALNGLFGWNNEMWEDRDWKESKADTWPFSPRRAAQTLGTEWGRSLHPEMWLELAGQQIEAVKLYNQACKTPIYKGVVIPDIRFENEAAWLRARGGVVWHVERPGVKKVEAHSSEAGVKLQAEDELVSNYADIGVLLSTVSLYMVTEKTISA